MRLNWRKFGRPDTMIWPQRQPTLHNGRIHHGHASARPLQLKLYTEAAREIMLKTSLVMIANVAAPSTARFAVSGGTRPGR